MTSFIYMYFIIALSGAILSHFYICKPAIKAVSEKTSGDHVFVRYPNLAKTVFFALSFLATPLLVRPLLFDDVREDFIENLAIGSITND